MAPCGARSRLARHAGRAAGTSRAPRTPRSPGTRSGDPRRTGNPPWPADCHPCPTPHAVSDRGTYLNTIAHRSSCLVSRRLQPWVDRLGFQCQYREDALMYPPERLAARDPVERLKPQRVLPCGQGALVPEAAGAEPVKICRLGVVGAVDDAQVLTPAHLQAWLHEAATA